MLLFSLHYVYGPIPELVRESMVDLSARQEERLYAGDVSCKTSRMVQGLPSLCRLKKCDSFRNAGCAKAPASHNPPSASCSTTKGAPKQSKHGQTLAVDRCPLRLLTANACKLRVRFAVLGFHLRRPLWDCLDAVGHMLVFPSLKVKSRISLLVVPVLSMLPDRVLRTSLRQRWPSL